MKKLLNLFLALTFVVSINATPYFSDEPVDFIEGDITYPFERIELLYDSSTEFYTEKIHEGNKLNHPAFLELTQGHNVISSGNFFLHYSKDWDKKSDKRPILLVHGAGDNAFRAWAHPFKYYFAPGEFIEYPGLALVLPKKGYQVFSLSFNHSQGDNFMQSEHIANAITRIKKVLGEENNNDFKIDVIAHSKGGVATTMYLSDIREEYSEYSWLTPYREDVDRFIAIATPLNGVDAQYRYYGLNLTVIDKDMPSPLGAKSVLYYGFWRDFSDVNDMFPGQRQILNNLVNDKNTRIGFSNLSNTMDMNYSRNVLYNGGVSSILISEGINKEIAKGKYLISTINKKGIHPSVDIIIMAGTDNQIDDNIEFWADLLPFGENIAPSDMLLFVKSATYTDGITKRGAKVIGKRILPYNHMNITFHTEAVKNLLELMEK
ncbi:MAG: hypothetical protein M0R46_12200 [Candidatus Muirbacterium halophilum]|nr:hypothetical protein [Candidatus Muirbacterium halophilum]MCK9476678.1 hypothetical protein [Candidatus Muirbacterium halophilum]